MLIFPGVTTDAVGLTMVAVVFILQFAAAKKGARLAAPAE